MVDDDYVPRRGDIIWLNFDPQAGHEQAGHRSALVLSPHSYNVKTNLALVCPITSQVKGYPFEAGLHSSGTVSGVALADQLKSLDWRARQARFEGHAAERVTLEVIGKAKAILD